MEELGAAGRYVDKVLARMRLLSLNLFRLREFLTTLPTQRYLLSPFIKPKPLDLRASLLNDESCYRRSPIYSGAAMK
jgi:hypothetical protein